MAAWESVKAPVAFRAWVDQVLPDLKPPVANRLLYDGALKIMIVGGPNERSDFHIEEGEELFYQIKGDMRLDIVEGGKLRQIPIKEGEMFHLPARVFHSPQVYSVEFETSSGLCGISEMRASAFVRFDGVKTVLYEEWFHCDDLGVQLVPVIKRFRESEACKTGIPTETPKDPPITLDMTVRPPPPCDLDGIVRSFNSSGPRNEVMVLYDSEFTATLLRGPSDPTRNEWIHAMGEVFLYVLAGTISVALQSSQGNGDAEERTFELKAQDVFLVPAGFKHLLKRKDAEAITLYITNIATGVRQR